MKCAYRQVVAYKALEDAYSYMGELLLRFLDLSTGHVLHSNEKIAFGQKRLYDFFERSAKDLVETLNFYSGDDDDDREAVDTTLFVYRRNLKDIGVDVVAIDRDLAEHFRDATKMVKDKRKTRSRLGFLERAELSVQTYYCAALWYLHTEHGFAAGRLPDIYRELKTLYNEWSVAYASGTTAGDAVCREMMRQMQTELESVGILFHEIKKNKINN